MPLQMLTAWPRHAHVSTCKCWGIAAACAAPRGTALSAGCAKSQPHPLSELLAQSIPQRRNASSLGKQAMVLICGGVSKTLKPITLKTLEYGRPVNLPPGVDAMPGIAAAMARSHSYDWVMAAAEGPETDEAEGALGFEHATSLVPLCLFMRSCAGWRSWAALHGGVRAVQTLPWQLNRWQLEWSAGGGVAGFSAEQVEEVRMVIRMLPVFLTTILYWTIYAQVLPRCVHARPPCRRMCPWFGRRLSYVLQSACQGVDNSACYSPFVHLALVNAFIQERQRRAGSNVCQPLHQPRSRHMGSTAPSVPGRDPDIMPTSSL